MMAATGKATGRWQGMRAPLVHLLLIALVIMMAKSLAELTWLPFQQWTPTATPPPATIGRSGGQGGVQVAALVSGHLFGQVEDNQVQRQVLSQVEAPRTRLQLLLEGVFVAEQDQDSGAIVAERGKTAQFYRVGDALPGSAELVAVFADRVVLRRQGRLETLSFEETLLAREQLQAVEQPRVSSPEEFVSVAQRQLAENPQAALGSVGLQPVASSGQPQGYVYNGNNPMLRALNLQPGDIIRSVNGHPLGDMQRDRELLAELSQQELLEVEVERGGASFTVSYPLRRN